MLRGEAKTDYQREYMRKRREAQRVARAANISSPSPATAGEPAGSDLDALKAEIERLTHENERLRNAALSGQGDAPVTRDDLSESQKTKLDRAIKAEMKRLQDAFYDQLEAKVKKFAASMHEDWKRKVDFVNDFNAKTRNMGFPFTRDEFKLVRNCLHPDRLGQLLPPGAVLDDKVRAQYAEAFSLFNEKEPKLVRPVAPTGGEPFPATADELLKRKRK
jgi:hypothetical protein